MIVRAAFALLLSASAAAEDPAGIVRRSLDHMVFRRGGVEMQTRMALVNSRGETRERRMFVRTRADGGLTRTIATFLAPPDVAGTKFLLIENRGRDDDRYLYLPQLRRVRRVAGSEKNQSFMGSDFTYADLEGRDVEMATYATKGEEAVGGKPCHVIDARPRPEADSPYTRVRLWIRKADAVGLKTEFYGRDGALVKKLAVHRIETVDGRIVITESRMESLGKGHATTFLVDKITFRDDIPADEFTPQKLEQG